MRAELDNLENSAKIHELLGRKRRQAYGGFAALLRRHSALAQYNAQPRLPYDLLALVAGNIIEPLLDLGIDIKREGVYIRQDVHTLTKRIVYNMNERKRRKQEEMGRNMLIQLIVRQPGGAFWLWKRQRHLMNQQNNK